jgi:hypothetical protein
MLKNFRDSTDHSFDLSRWLLDLHGFVPIVSPITEPAVGYGAVLAGVFFIPKKNTDKKVFKMPDIVGGAGGLTQNGTWFAGGGYAGFWKNDHIRYRGIGGYGDINLKYYGNGNDYFTKNPADFTIASSFFLQQAIFRIGNSNFLLGGNYQFLKTQVTAFEESKLPFVDSMDFNVKSSGLTFISEFDNFKNILSPNRGLKVHLGYLQNLEFIGSDRNYGRLTFYTLYYLPLTKSWFSGFRIESDLSTGDAPFYALPYIYLRGVPAMRYQGQIVLIGETEQFVNVYKRWSLVGFAGAGKTYSNLADSQTSSSAWNAGGGFRYLVARMLGLQMGLDAARGPEQWAFYIVFGSSWLK